MESTELMNLYGALFESSFSLTFSLIINILVIVEYWMIFQKAGEAGWKILIPFYGQYIKYKMAGKKNLYWWVLGLGIFAFVCIFAMVGTLAVGIAADSAGALGGSLVLSLLMIAVGIAMIVLEVKMFIGLAKKFGKSGAFAAGLIFLEPIFAGILAFSNDAKYEDHKPASVFDNETMNQSEF